jgi:hypothetical protein
MTVNEKAGWFFPEPRQLIVDESATTSLRPRKQKDTSLDHHYAL